MRLLIADDHPIVLEGVEMQGLATRVVLLSGSLTTEEAREAIRLGADGLILKEAAGAELVDCLRAVKNGRQWINPEAVRLAVHADNAGSDTALCRERNLTPREVEIVRKIARGQRNKEVARELGITEGSVKMYLHRIYQKFKVTNRTELSTLARDQGLI